MIKIFKINLLFRSIASASNGFTAILLVVLFGLLFTSSCQKSDDATGVSKIRIGLLLPETGSAASAGESAQAAADLAVRDVNNYLLSTGNNWQVEFIFKDTGTDPAQALEKLKELDALGIRYVVGPYASASAEACLDYANENGMILLSPSSVATSLAIAGDNLFRLVPSDKNQAVAVRALLNYDNIETVIPVVRDDVWGEGLISDVTPLLTQDGKTVVNPIRFDPANVDAVEIASQVGGAVSQALQQTSADKVGVYMLSFGEGTSILAAASQIPDCGLVRWYGSSAYANNAGLPGDAAAPDFALNQDFRCPVFAPDQAGMDLWGPIDQELIASLGRSPEVYALTTYDAVWLLTMAYRECANPNDVTLFSTSLEEAAKFHFGITGRATFDAAGDRKYASFEFWGMQFDGNAFSWKAYGHFNNSNGQLVIY